MARIELNALTVKMKPEQKIFTAWFYSQFDYAAPGINRHINNVEPLFYQGLTAGSEFTVYAATKLYLCLSLEPGGATENTSLEYMEFHDAANNIIYYYSNDSGYYNVTGAALDYITNNFNFTNNYFSRIVTSNITTIKFIGYRITLN